MHTEALWDQIQIVVSSILLMFCIYYVVRTEARQRWKWVLLPLAAGISALLQPVLVPILILPLLLAFASLLSTKHLSIQSTSVGTACIALASVMMGIFAEPRGYEALWLLPISVVIACWFFTPEIRQEKLTNIPINKFRPALWVAGFQLALFLNVQATTIICSCEDGGDEPGNMTQDCGCGSYNWSDDFFTLEHVNAVWKDLGSE